MFWLDKINQMKKEKGMTTDDISNLSGIAKGTLNKLFAGQTKDPQLSTIKAVVHCMGYTLDDLDDKSDITVDETPQLSGNELALIKNFRSLNDEGQQKVNDYINDLVFSGRYIKNNQSGVCEDA